MTPSLIRRWTDFWLMCNPPATPPMVSNTASGGFFNAPVLDPPLDRLLAHVQSRGDFADGEQHGLRAAFRRFGANQRGYGTVGRSHPRQGPIERVQRYGGRGEQSLEHEISPFGYGADP